MSFRTPRTRVALAVLAVLAPAALQAQEALQQVTVTGRAEPAEYRPERSSSFTKTDTPLKEVPASVTVVPAQVMKDQAMQSLADVVRYVPGATAHQGEGNRDQFVLRGISTTADLFVDGIRDDAQVFRDLYNLERVEVLKGPAGMMFGRGGAGGIVHRVTRKPVFEDVRAGSITLGEHSQRRGTLDVGGALGERMAWRLDAMVERADSFRSGVDLERRGINPTLTLKAGPATAVTFGVEHQKDDRTADRGVPARDGRPVDVDPATFFGNPDQSRARSSFNTGYVLLEHTMGAVQLKNHLRVTHYDKFYQNVYPDNANASSVNAAGTLRLAAYNNANRRTNVFNQTDLLTTVQAGGMEHKLLAGLELGHQDSENRRNTGFFGALGTQQFATVNVASPFAVATVFRPNGTDADNEVKADVAGVYVQDQVALTPQWKVVAGLRYDVFRVKFDDRRTTVAPADLQRTDREFSPRLGLIWTPNAASTYYLSYSYAFLPSAEQLSLAPNTADLAPEKAKNYEIGARWDVLPGLMVSAALFRLDRDDVRSPDTINPGLFVKTGRQRTEGLELGVQGRVMRGWEVYGGYAHLNGRITQTTAGAAAGSRLQLVPNDMVSLWNRVDLAGGWSAGLGWIYQGASYTSLDNRVLLPKFNRTDGALYYAFAGGRARLALNVENLTDKRYWPTADGNNNISPGAPRTARVTLDAAF